MKQMISILNSAVITASILLLFALAVNVESVQALNIQEVQGQRCPAGTTLVTVNELADKTVRQNYCNTLGQWDIVRLANGGSMDGSGYNCKIRDKDTRSLGNALCKELNIAIGDGKGICPDHYALASVAEAQENKTAICNNVNVGAWYIMKLANGGSMDGSGYGCGVRTNDTRCFGDSVCIETL